MLITNTESVPGARIVHTFGLVQGNVTRAKHIGRDIMAGFKQLVGGEISGYTELLNEAREQATKRMTEAAQAMNANAVLNVRFTTSMIMQGVSEILAYGTAVVIEPDEQA